MTFPDFYKALYGRRPFPWQAELARRVIAESTSEAPAGNVWPHVLDLPTAAGKTTVLDIAVYHLVHQLVEKSDRTAPLRIFFIVDRRIVVDGTFQHARRIADSLSAATTGPLKQARDAICSYFDVARPLHVAVMRGGMYRDDGWTSSPVQPTICVSTVDQVGSRLLFRGYGVTPSMRPVHAGLVANDSLLFIDEAHLSQPFLQTLDAVRGLTQSQATDALIQRPLQFVTMSATTGETATETFGLDENPDELDTENVELRKRMTASKLASFLKISVDKDDSLEADKTFAVAAATQALEFAGTMETAPKKRTTKNAAANVEGSPPVRVIGIVVNRVRAARLIFDKLREQFPHDAEGDQAPEADVILLTGRIRPYDRDELLFRRPAQSAPDETERGWLRWLAADRKVAPRRPIFVVATQTVEVGADISFDALVTEAAPLDCLRQRFGRLDRLGRRQSSRAVIIGRNTAVAKTNDDPIYGRAIGETWAWLEQTAMGSGKSRVIDFGLASMNAFVDKLASDQLETLLAPRKDAPFLQAPYAELWSQTNPAPAADPDITRFLHGEETSPAGVQIVWRADLLNHGEQALLNRYETDYINTVSLVPPTQMEACTVPVRDVRAWLRHVADKSTQSLASLSVELADVEGGQQVGDRGADRGALVLRWKGPEHSKIARVKDVRPGDTIIVPSAYGGCDEFGWQPDSVDPEEDRVDDVAEACVRWSRGRPVLRCHPALLQQWRVAVPSRDGFSEGGTDPVGQAESILKALSAAATLPNGVRETVEWLIEHQDLEDRRRRPIPYSLQNSEASAGCVILSNERPSIQQILKESQAILDDPSEFQDMPQEDDASSFVGTGVPVSLTDHTDGVLRHADRFGNLAGLSPAILKDLKAAAQWHDVGKMDPRFQAMLHDGDELAAILAMQEGRLLGKSGIPSTDGAARNRARRMAGVPKGFSHEALSIILLRQPEQADLLAQTTDADLVQYLIGSHHGDGRAMHRVVVDDDPPDVDAEWEGRRWQCAAEVRAKSALCRLESDWAGLFARVNRRYGIWGLAWLEALFRLADHRQSALDEHAVRTTDPAAETASHA